MVLREVKLENGQSIKFEETPYYYKVSVGKRTWYWIKKTGQFDGVSYQVS
jgi:hypothetical protein